MSKKVLAIYYSQSGQLGEIVENFTAPLVEAGVSVEYVRVRLVNEPNFPWTGDTFFSVMPNCQLDVPAELQPFELKEEKYDLVVLGYQAWFLSPSIPFNSLMQTPQLKAVLKNTPVITITGARNMWLNAFVRVKKLINTAGAKLVGNVALVDKHPNPVSFVTIFHWMLHGKKDKYLNIFPPPGVSDADIKNTKAFGESVLEHLNTDSWAGLQDKLDAQKAVVLNYNLMVIEGVAGKIFRVWANFISKRKNKLPWIRAFKYYLLIAFFVGAPIVVTIDGILFRFTSPKRKRARKQYYLNLN
ncbi:hypothetical protein [Mucilaginibacter auburnensis]|uniref:Uncharacterized protein n=1 Tax=Mucilaginibacter auburnensis TaxID=1457233 RepID=A0A2H9VMG4_9SPHI|nr:hypothetical protein [Mucilaginibacter auburnensis]PJJ79531.1 hypothetical protein CLV57_2665 [Mucilaginibacter auburnensis]